MFGLFTLVLIVFMSVSADWLAPYPYDEIDLGKARTAAKVVKMPFYNPVRGS